MIRDDVSVNDITITDAQVFGNSDIPTSHNIEFFHIYTDEEISDGHNTSIEYLQSISSSWEFDYSTIILVDNYNPTNHILEIDAVFMHLESRGALPHYWAYEADMIDNAKELLATLPNNKLRRRYEKYIADHNKYPCSLLTASWYLTRLGHLDYGIISPTNNGDSYIPAQRLINILPAGYKDVELRARGIIKSSPYHQSLDGIQDLFIPVDAKKVADLL